MIEFRNVEKKYATSVALWPTSLQLEMGKTHIFLGSSGSGKSTLLRLLSGLIAPSSGEIFLNGEKVLARSAKPVGTKIGYVIQEGGLFPHLTAFQNAALQARAQGWSEDKISQRIQDLSKLVQMNESLLQQFPKELSGGQRQRVALMRALMLDPDLILLDEPLGALDPLVRSDLQHELKHIFNLVRKTVIIVTHDINEAAFFGHTLSLFHEGKLLQHGSFEDLAARPACEFVTRFLHAQLPSPEVLALTV
jgi:osmoprotectant transport system ATP-binding protein